MPSSKSPEYSANVVFQGEASVKAIVLIYVVGFGLVFGICAGLGLGSGYYGLVFLGALVISSILVMLSYKKLKARAQRVAVVSFTPPVLFVPDQEPLDLTSAHDLRVLECEGRLFLHIRTPLFVDIGLGGLSRTEAEEAFGAPYFIEPDAHVGPANLTLDPDHIEFSRALIAEAGRNRMANQSFAIWKSYPWDQPYDPRPLSPEATPDTLSEQLAWPDPEIGVSASYIFFREEEQWRILPLGGGLEVSLETEASTLSFQNRTAVTYVYVLLRSPETQARICMKESGSIHPGEINTAARRAFVAFVNSRTRHGLES